MAAKPYRLTLLSCSLCALLLGVAAASVAPFKIDVAASDHAAPPSSKPSQAYRNKPTAQPVHNALYDSSDRPVMGLYDYYPYTHINENGQPHGIFWDFFNQLKNESGLDLAYRILPLGRTLHDAQAGRLDLLISYQDHVMAKGVDFIAPFACARELVVLRSGIKAENLADLKGLNITFPQGGYFETHYAKTLGITSMPHNRSESLLQLLEINRVDGFVVSDWSFMGQLNPDHNQTIAPNQHVASIDDLINSFPFIGGYLVVSEIPVGLSVQSDSPHYAISAPLKESMQRLRRQGVFRKILHSHNVAPGPECTQHTEFFDPETGLALDEEDASPLGK